MIPILYEKNEVAFDNNGICRLDDAISWTVTEKLNDSFELKMTYPVDGEHFSDVTVGRVIFAKPNPFDDAQPFDIYAISKPLKGKITVYAEHISYRMRKIVVSRFGAVNVVDALSAVKKNSVNDNPFTFDTDMATVNDINFYIPITCRHAVARIASLYDGELKYDRFSVFLYGARGSDKGFSIRYGQNLTDLKQNEDISELYDGIYPYYRVEDDYVELPEKYILADGVTVAQRLLPLDLTAEFEFGEIPTADQLRREAEHYLKYHDINKGKLSIDIKFVLLAQYEEYKDIAALERAEIGDLVDVFVPKRGIHVKAKIVKTVYDGKKDKYDSVLVGDVKGSITDSFVSLENQVLEAVTQIGLTGKTVARLTVKSDELEGRVDALATWQSENEDELQSIASISAEAKANSAAIIEITKWQDTTTESIANVTQTADKNKADITSITVWQNATETNISKIEQTAVAAGAAIGLIVENNEVKGSVLVKAINGQSEATIAADRVDLAGYVTVKSLGAEGTTVIDGSRIITGQIASKNYVAGISGAMLDLENGIVNITSGSKIAGWTTTKDVFGKSTMPIAYPPTYAVVGLNSANIGRSGDVLAIGTLSESYTDDPLNDWGDTSKYAPFRVTGEGALYSVKGNIAGWDITEDGFSKETTESYSFYDVTYKTVVSPDAITSEYIATDTSGQGFSERPHFASLRNGILFIKGDSSAYDISGGITAIGYINFIQIQDGEGFTYDVYLKTSDMSFYVRRRED